MPLERQAYSSYDTLKFNPVVQLDVTIVLQFRLYKYTFAVVVKTIIARNDLER